VTLGNREFSSNKNLYNNFIEIFYVKLSLIKENDYSSLLLEKAQSNGTTRDKRITTDTHPR
jgi:hypothetical protein